MVDYAILFLL